MAAPKRGSGKGALVNFRANPSLVARATARAQSNGITLSELIRTAVIREVQDAA